MSAMQWARGWWEACLCHWLEHPELGERVTGYAVVMFSLTAR